MAISYGYLFSWDGFGKKGIVKGYGDEFRKLLVEMTNIKEGPEKKRLNVRGWISLKFLSGKPLLGEDPGFLRQSPFQYDVWVRVNEHTGNIIISAQRYSITESVVDFFNFKYSPHLRKMVIDVGKLTDYMFHSEEKKFFITYFMADVRGFGPSLTSISLYGDDIAASNPTSTVPLKRFR